MTTLLSPLAWLAASFAAYALATNAAWHAHERAPHRTPSAAAQRVAAWAYLAGVPIAALAARVPASPANLGLIWPGRPEFALGTAAIVGGLVAAAIAAAPAAKPWRALALRRGARPSPSAAAASLGLALCSAAAMALHVAFVRSVVLASGIGLGDGPAGGAPAMLATLALLGVEALLNPWVRHAIVAEGTPPAALVRGAGLAVADAAAFALAGSLVATLVARLAAAGFWHAAHGAERVGLGDGEAEGDGTIADGRAVERAIEPTIV